MANESTSKMLAKMLKDKTLTTGAGVSHEQPEYFDAPQLKPGADMEQVLANILGPSFKQENIPS